LQKSGRLRVPNSPRKLNKNQSNTHGALALDKRGFENSMTVYTGSCLCGGVRFSVTGPLEPIQICHCSQCRKAQGAPFASNVPVKLAQFELHAGEDILTMFRSSPAKTRAFCSRCGSPIYSRREDLPGVLRVRAGLFEQPLRARPSLHAYVGDKANWWTIDDDLPQFAEAAP